MRTNVATKTAPVFTHEGGRAQNIDAFRELQRSVMTCLLFENSFYESGSEIADRIAALVQQVDPAKVYALACEARDRMQLRHVPLFLLRELARRKGCGGYVQRGLAHVIQRADEMGEFLAIYWKDRKTGDRKRPPVAPSIKRGLAQAFPKFDAYQLAKYDRETAVRLRDVLFLCHPKPKDSEQAAVWKLLVDGKLESPDTWEVALSAGKDKKETFERLIREGMLGGLALLRNLRNMIQAGVDEDLIRERLAQGAARALPFRFVVAAKYAPRLEDAIEVSMLKSIEQLDRLTGRTGLLIDISGSMDYRLGGQPGESRTVFQSGLVARAEETSRIDAAAALAILLREKADAVEIATFSSQVAIVPPRRGFALRDAISQSQPHSATHLRAAVEALSQHPAWKKLDRMIVITDEQSQDGNGAAFAPRSYVVNVAPYKNGISYGNGWNHIDGWSERILDYVREYETLEASA